MLFIQVAHFCRVGLNSIYLNTVYGRILGKSPARNTIYIHRVLFFGSHQLYTCNASAKLCNSVYVRLQNSVYVCLQNSVTLHL
jgi:hypothetical protein